MSVNGRAQSKSHLQNLMSPNRLPIYFSQSKSLLGTFLQRESEPDKETRWVNKGGTLMDLAGPFLPKPPLKPLFDYWHSEPVGGRSEWLQRSDDDATLYICYVCLSLAAVLNELRRTCCRVIQNPKHFRYYIGLKELECSYLITLKAFTKLMQLSPKN